MTEAERDAALIAFIHDLPKIARNVENSSRQLDAMARSQRTLEGKVDGVAIAQRTLEGKVDGLASAQSRHGDLLEKHSGLMTTLNADQARLRSEVQGKIKEVSKRVHEKLADVIDEDAVSEMVESAVTGAQKAIKIEEARQKLAEEAAAAKAKLAEIEAEKRRQEDKKAEDATKLRDARRALKYAVVSGVVVGLVLLVSGVVVGRVTKDTAPAGASTIQTQLAQPSPQHHASARPTAWGASSSTNASATHEP